MSGSTFSPDDLLVAQIADSIGVGLSSSRTKPQPGYKNQRPPSSPHRLPVIRSINTMTYSAFRPQVVEAVPSAIAVNVLSLMLVVAISAGTLTMMGF